MTSKIKIEEKVDFLHYSQGEFKEMTENFHGDAYDIVFNLVNHIFGRKDLEEVTFTRNCDGFVFVTKISKRKEV
jgi:hypothetical protein